MFLEVSYRLTAPSGVGGIDAAVQISDEVAVILEVEIHAVIEAGEGGVGRRHVEVFVGEPDLIPGAEYRRGSAGENEDGFEEHFLSCNGILRKG